MALHISVKLCALGVVLAALITAFSTPPQTDEIPVSVQPTARVVEVPREAVALPSRPGPVAVPKMTLKATGYNSLESQTDSTPHVTAIGSQTRFGIVAVSRDLLDAGVPYGSLVRLKDLGNYYNGRGAGRFQEMLDSQSVFIVEDTMHQRKRGQVDVWFPHLSDAINWGVRQVELEVIRYGWDGPELYAQAPSDFETLPRLAAVR